MSELSKQARQEAEGCRQVGGFGETVAILELLADRIEELEAENKRLLDGMERAWGIIANAGEGDWSTQTSEWVNAAEKWRDEQWHPALDRAGLGKDD